jgi:guanine nucleotide-binding protein subunit gamma
MSEDSPKKPMNQKLLVLKLKRINELNKKLKDTLSRDRIYASNASYSIINYTQQNKDYTLPEIWGHMEPGQNPFRNNRLQRNGGSEGQDGCCTIM